MELPRSAAKPPLVFAADATRAGVDEAAIGRFVAEFYARIRVDPLLGPVFAKHVSDWGRYEDEVRAYWSAVAGRAKEDDACPQQVHLSHLIDRWHFDRWLELFEVTAGEVCRPETAAYFVERARRIAVNLEEAVVITSPEPSGAG